MNRGALAQSQASRSCCAAKPRALWRLTSEDGELMPEGEKRDEQGRHAGRERYQPSAQICDGDKRFPTSGRDTIGEELDYV